MNLKIKKINRIIRGWFIIIFFIIFIVLLFMFMFTIVSGGYSYQKYCAGVRWMDGADLPCPLYYSTVWKPIRYLLYLFFLIIIGGIIFIIISSYLTYRFQEKEFKKKNTKIKMTILKGSE
ncbi:hypothetical protein LCGC14_1468730 [marine sediment metagenome]|uniref:Uncharacterized protein n=1 Tax=marine sediment metagenome TaxID=412755 RepID=A0A0F9JDI8_9ZZZZ